ncbi:molybdenum cofactor guanylyltransferase [Polymorphobacter sp.]|uniref:molybdenum cofactor guanylyltransferase n=1 Tax=Polymorphobacter sp. TaxID=1909290 RepID=UPI003F71B709
MIILGAILAGGQSRRFGSDKALAPLHGQPLISHAIRALHAETPNVVVCGRAWPGHVGLSDRIPGAGPLAGLCAALEHAHSKGYSHVLIAPCDMAIFPPRLASALAPAPAVAASQPTLGLWPAPLAPRLFAHLAAGHRSLMSWVEASGARTVHLGLLTNINTPADLAALHR